MPLPFAGPLLTAGAGSTLPITGGAATSGPIDTNISLAPIRIGSVFGDSGDNGGSNILPIVSLAAVAALAFMVFWPRR